MKYFILTSFASIAALAVLALGGEANSQQSAPAVDPVQVARGAQAWAQECSRCHNLRAPSELTDEEWEVSTMHMRVRANIPGDVIRDIQVFLKNSN